MAAKKQLTIGVYPTTPFKKPHQLQGTNLGHASSDGYHFAEESLQANVNYRHSL